MPARQRGWTRKRQESWQACWREGGRVRTRSGFPSKTAAKDWLDDQLENGSPRRGRDVTYADHVGRYLRVHGTAKQPGTMRALRQRLGARTEIYTPRPRSYETPIEAFGDVTLADLEHMSGEIAEWATTLPERYRHAIVRAFSQTLTAAVRWRLIRTNPVKEAGPNPQPERVEKAFFATHADVDKVAVELGDRYAPIPIFGVETGLRPEEWTALERRDVDRQERVVRVRRVFVDGELREIGKSSRWRRDVPLTTRALAAIDALPPRVDTPLLFPAPKGGHLDLHNWRNREWHPAIEAAGLALCTCGRLSGEHDDAGRLVDAGCKKFKRARGSLSPYSMRHTFASFALATGEVSLFDLSRLMGASVQVIDLHYGHLVHDTHDRVRQALERRAQREAKAAEDGARG